MTQLKAIWKGCDVIGLVISVLLFLSEHTGVNEHRWKMVQERPWIKYTELKTQVKKKKKKSHFLYPIEGQGILWKGCSNGNQ